MYLLHCKKIDIYANISFQIRWSVQMLDKKPRDDIDSLECQKRPGQLDEPPETEDLVI